MSNIPFCHASPIFRVRQLQDSVLDCVRAVCKVHEANTVTRDLNGPQNPYIGIASVTVCDDEVVLDTLEVVKCPVWQQNAVDLSVSSRY